MTEIRHFAGWLRSLTGLAAIAGVLALSGCGGGSGAPNNFFDGFMSVSPPSAVAYSGVPTTLTINGGAGPFQATSSDTAALGVSVAGRTVILLANNVAAETAVNVTIRDLGPLINQTEIVVPVTVRASALGNSLTITPTSEDCGTAVCSGQTALATVTVLNSQGSPLGRAVRFDVIGSSYAIVTNNPAQPFAPSLTVLTDSTGKASVVLLVNANAPTQFAQLRVTDVASGQQLVGNFVIQQNTDGSTTLTVVPETATITGAFKGVCSNGFPIDYYIFGGTPPYRVSATFPNAVTLVNSTVNTNGGFFRAITNGTCVDPLTFSIVDATGRQTTAQLQNVEGTEERPVVTPPDLAVLPVDGYPAETSCFNRTFPFIVAGGTTPYSVTAIELNSAMSVPVTLTAGVYRVGPIPVAGLSTTVVSFKDQSSPQKATTRTISCT